MALMSGIEVLHFLLYFMLFAITYWGTNSHSTMVPVVTVYCGTNSHSTMVPVVTVYCGTNNHSTVILIVTY